GWWAVAEVASRCGLDLGVTTSSTAFAQLVEAVPFYAGLTLEEIGGRGVRWVEREAASAMPSGDVGDFAHMSSKIPQTTSETPRNGGLALRLGLFRPIWAAPEVEISPILKYTIARQQAELSPEDARRMGITTGDQVIVSQNGTSLTAPAVVRSGVTEGTVFLATGLAADSGNELAQAEVE